MLLPTFVTWQLAVQFLLFAKTQTGAVVMLSSRVVFLSVCSLFYLLFFVQGV